MFPAQRTVKGLISIWMKASQDSPSCHLFAGIVSELCGPECGSVTGCTPHYTQRLRLCPLPESHQDSLSASQPPLGALSTLSLSLSLPFIVLQKMSFYPSIILPLSWDVHELSEHVFSSLGSFFLWYKPDTVSNPVHHHFTVSAAVRKSKQDCH